MGEVTTVASLTNGSGAPPAGWDADEAAERIRRRAHALPEHKTWLAEKDDEGQLKHYCEYCDA